jgi:hypothetical protein
MTAMFTLQSRWIAMAVAIAAVISGSTAFAASAHGAHSCLVEVLTSEMLPAVPPFYHTVKARLLVTPADRPPFETTVVHTIPWQAPSPRQGQRIWMPCEQALAQYDFHLF